MLTGLKLWHLVISLLAVLRLRVSGEEKMVADKDDENDVRSSKNIFNFASQAAGAVVLDKSPSTAKGYSHLLNDDMDKYGISACDEKKWVVIGLSEDILVTSIALANYEKYSSMLKEFQLLASTSYPTEKWINLGIYEAQPRLGMQTFNVSDSSVHTRYLKVKFNTHYGTEDLCTLSQVRTEFLLSTEEGWRYGSIAFSLNFE
jgi:Sad1 / UNC-like C-terminal